MSSRVISTLGGSHQFPGCHFTIISRAQEADLISGHHLTVSAPERLLWPGSEGRVRSVNIFPDADKHSQLAFWTDSTLAQWALASAYAPDSPETLVSLRAPISMKLQEASEAKATRAIELCKLPSKM